LLYVFVEVSKLKDKSMPHVAERLNRLPPYVFSVIGDRIRKMQRDGIDIFRMDIGSPDLPPPEAVVKALSDSARGAVNHGYTGYRGTDTFRQAVADFYSRRFGVAVHPDTEVLPLL
jgi:LL-diaminopimelate aminotransferase